MINKPLSILNFLLFGLILVTPFYTGYSFLKVLTPYLLSLLWFSLIILIGIQSLFSILMVIVYFIVALIWFSYGLDYLIMFSMSVGIFGAVLIFFSSGMHRHEP